MLFGVIGFVAIDDLLEIFPDAVVLHRLVLEAPATGREEHVAQTRVLCLFERLLDTRDKLRRVGVESMLASDFHGVSSNF